MKLDFIQKIPVTTFLFGIALFGYLFLAFSHLGSFVTADEGKWVYERIPQYWQAIGQGDLEKTFINDKPGISLALLGAPAILRYPDAQEHCVEGKDKVVRCQVERSQVFYETFRMPLVIVNALLLIFLFWVIGRITNVWIALWSTVLMGFSPPLIGISQIVNPDALLWSFGSASAFSFFWYLKSGLRRAVLWSGVFLGGALLSKYVALIFLPFYFGVIVLRFLVLEDSELEDLRGTLRRDLVALGALSLIAVALLSFFLPALVIDPDRITDFLATIEGKGVLFGGALVLLVFFLADTLLLQSRWLLRVRELCQKYRFVFSWIPVGVVLVFLGVLITRLVLVDWNIFTEVRFDLKELTNAVDFIGRELSWHEALLLNLSPVVYALTPVTLVGLVCLALEMRKKRLSSYYFFAVSLALLIVLYEAILIFTNVFATIRYSILLYPILTFLSALGFWHYSRYVPLKNKELWLTVILFGVSVVSVWSSKPFYFNYTNFLLPKSHIITDAWGYGGYEAAQYLNTQPDAQNITIWADYYGVCEFFVGKCVTAYNFDKEAIRPDYYVLTRRGRIRYWSRYPTWEERSGLVAYKYYDREDPVWSREIGRNQANTVKIFRVEK